MGFIPWSSLQDFAGGFSFYPHSPSPAFGYTFRRATGGARISSSRKKAIYHLSSPGVSLALFIFLGFLLPKPKCSPLTPGFLITHLTVLERGALSRQGALSPPKLLTNYKQKAWSVRLVPPKLPGLVEGARSWGI